MLEFEEQPLVQEGPTSVGSVLSNFREFSAGAGINVAKLNKEGWFIGGSDFASAPFSVDYTGHVIATSADFPHDSTKLDALGGAYNTAASGARVRIFPDANTGLLIVDDAGAEVFKALIAGADVGDVIIGNYAGNKGLKWDKSAATFTVRGSLNADDITAGTLTGRTIKAVGTGVASDVWLDSSAGTVSFYYGGVKKADIYCDTSGTLLITAVNDVLLQSTDDFVIDSNGSFDLFADSAIRMQYNYNGGTDSFLLYSNSVNMLQLDANGDLYIGRHIVASGNVTGVDILSTDDIQCGDTFRSSDGSAGGNYTSIGFVTSIRANGGNLEAKYREITVKDGLVTNIAAESGWNNMGPY